MKYRGQECTESRPITDGSGTGVEWRFPANSTGAPWPTGEKACIQEHATRVVPQSEKDAAALIAAVAEEASIEGIQLDYGKNSTRRTRQSFVEDCPAIKADATVTPTHIITTTVGGVRVKLLAQIDEE
jgi:hypothetical protein